MVICRGLGFAYFVKKYVNFYLLQKSVAPLRIGGLVNLSGAETKVSPRVSSGEVVTAVTGDINAPRFF